MTRTQIITHTQEQGQQRNYLLGQPENNIAAYLGAGKRNNIQHAIQKKRELSHDADSRHNHLLQWLSSTTQQPRSRSRVDQQQLGNPSNEDYPPYSITKVGRKPQKPGLVQSSSSSKDTPKRSVPRSPNQVAGGFLAKEPSRPQSGKNKQPDVEDYFNSLLTTQMLQNNRQDQSRQSNTTHSVESKPRSVT